MDRFFCLLYFVGVAYAVETTPDINATSFSAVAQTAEISSTLATLPMTSDEGSTVTTTGNPQVNEVLAEDRGTVRTTEASVPLALDLSKKQATTTDLEQKSVEANTESLPPMTSEARDVSLRPETTTAATSHKPPQTATTSHSSPPQTATTSHRSPPQTAHRSSPTSQTSSPSATHRHPEQDAVERHRPTTPSPSEATTKVFSPLARPNRKSSPAEAKKGTINTGLNQHSKKRKPSKKDNGMSSLVYIPLIIQAQMMPMMIMQLKFFALKALALGKLALILLGLNLLRNAIIGHNNDEQQYEHESLASSHYGYNGGPEYGSWVNRRMYKSSPEFIKQKETNEINSRNEFQNRDIRNNSRFSKMENGIFHIIDSNDPYRGQKHQQIEKSLVHVR